MLTTTYQASLRSQRVAIRVLSDTLDKINFDSFESWKCQKSEKSEKIVSKFRQIFWSNAQTARWLMERAVKATKTKMLNMEKDERERVCVWWGVGKNNFARNFILFSRGRTLNLECEQDTIKVHFTAKMGEWDTMCERKKIL